MTMAANIADVAILNFDACFPDSIVGFKSQHFVELE
jgi:type I restriction enzyme S subunit